MNLAEPGALKAFLKRHELSASKGLGQHFLVSKSVVEAIEERLSSCKGLLEIGPGPGVLTSPLSASSEKMIALEVDDRMIAALAYSAPEADVRKVDALKAPMADILGELPQPRGLVSNLPYYITGPLLTRIAEAKDHYSVAVLMMQKEVADKVVSKVGDRNRGSLSVYLQAQFEIERVVQVPAGSFLPPPKVDSTVLQFTPIADTSKDSESFQRLLRFAFAQPRKTLANNLIAGLRQPRDKVEAVLERAGYDERVRPQELSVDDWRRLNTLIEEAS